MIEMVKCPICGTENKREYYSEELGVVEDYYACSHCGYIEEMAYSPYREGFDTLVADPDVWPGPKRLYELAQADKEGRVVILPFKTPGWGWSCRKGYPTAVEAYYPFPSSVMREIETGRYVGKTKEEAEDIFLKKMLRTEKV